VTTLAAANAKLTGRYVACSTLTGADHQSMFSLLGAHFEGVDRETFEADLLEKNWVILLEDERRRLRGFSTLLVYESSVLKATIVYSGDTIVDCGFWGSPALLMTWLDAVRSLAPVESGQVYWLLLTSGYRTYRFLPVFFREFVPRVGTVASGEGSAKALRYRGLQEDPVGQAFRPAMSERILNALAAERFGSRFDPDSGIVRLARPQVLVPELLDIPEGRREDPHVAYFVRRNPGYVEGDELVCLTRVSDDNLTPAGSRIARSLRAG
jgi:hypothetical protein